MELFIVTSSNKLIGARLSDVGGLTRELSFPGENIYNQIFDSIYPSFFFCFVHFHLDEKNTKEFLVNRVHVDIEKHSYAALRS